MTKQPKQAGKPAPAKRKYNKPQLTEFGDITKLTQSGSGSGADGGGGMGAMFMMCL